MPQTYRDVLKNFAELYISPDVAERLSWFAVMRNIVAHDYLDITWKRIERFVLEAKELVPLVLEKIKNAIKEGG